MKQDGEDRNRSTPGSVSPKVPKIKALRLPSAPTVLSALIKARCAQQPLVRPPLLRRCGFPPRTLTGALFSPPASLSAGQEILQVPGPEGSMFLLTTNRWRDEGGGEQRRI